MKPPRTLVRDLAPQVGRTVRLCGWAAAVVGGAARQVVVLRDPSGSVEVVHDRSEGDDGLATALAELTRESAIEVVGRAAAGAGGQVEVVLSELDVVGPALAEPPIAAGTPLEERLDWRFLDLRRPENRLVFDVQTTVERAMREVWWENGFVELHTPKLRPTPNKSGSELFTVRYFDRNAYLAQSPQFYKQMAMASGLDRIFEVGPVFRANPLVTARHDTEFTSVDVEMSWIDSHEDVMAFEEGWLGRVLGAVKEAHGPDIERRFGVEVIVPEMPFPRVHMADAQRIVSGAGHRVEGKLEGDLDAEGERLLAEHVAREHGHQFVFVTDYPEWVRPFYHMRTDADPERTRSFDLLWKGLEVTTGAQREHRPDPLAAQAQARGVPLGPIGYYLDFFRYGCPPHGGFGLGLTRFLMQLLGQDDVREVTYLHRGPNRITP